jgi:AI-2 transport protein TqsA
MPAEYSTAFQTAALAITIRYRRQTYARRYLALRHASERLIRMIANRHLKTTTGLMAAVTLLWAISVASAVLAPLALALFIIAIVWPLQDCLRSRMPKLLALAICVLIIVFVFLAFTSLVVWSFGRVGRWLMNDAGRLQLLYDQAVSRLESHGLSVTGLWVDHFNAGWVVRAVQQVAGRVNTTMSFWLIALLYVILGLLEVDDMRRKISSLSNRDAARILIDGSAATAIKFRRYLLVRTHMSALTGLLVWLFVWLSGLQFAAEWGVIAFVLNYIPFIGPFIATMFPTLFAIAQYETWQAVLGLFICLNIIQFVVGSYVEPRVSGNVLSISPFVVLFAIFLWTFLWGLFGAFIGVPITIAIVTFCAQHPSTRWVAQLLGGPAYIGNGKQY